MAPSFIQIRGKRKKFNPAADFLGPTRLALLPLERFPRENYMLINFILAEAEMKNERKSIWDIIYSVCNVKWKLHTSSSYINIYIFLLLLFIIDSWIYFIKQRIWFWAFRECKLYFWLKRRTWSKLTFLKASKMWSLETSISYLVIFVITVWLGNCFKNVTSNLGV